MLLCAEVNADGTETADPASDPKAVVTDGKDGKAVAGATTEEAPEYKNWIELGIGGTIVHGDDAQFEQEHRLPADTAYGGIQDLHFEGTFDKDGLFSVDGHGIWDTNDYDIQVQLSKPKLGYIKAGFTEFRSWYDGNGGFYPPHGGTWFAPPIPETHIDRGDAWVELGLRVPDWPEITIRYEHEFRQGMKDSTTWGETDLTGGGNVLPGPTKSIVPSFRDIDETRDIFSFEASKTFGNTDVLLGMRYEHNENDDSLNMERAPGQLAPPPPNPFFEGGQRFVTQHNKDDIDLFSGHAITETRFTDNFWFTAGYSYTTLENDISGSRIFGTNFDSAFGEPVPQLGKFDEAFIDLAGMAQVKEHLFNANLFWMPLENLVILTGFRYTHEDEDASSTFLRAEVPFFPLTPPPFHFGPAAPISGERDSDYDRFAQRLELRYTGIKDWLFYFEGEWEEEWGHVNEQFPDEDVPLDKDTNALGQKYSIGANWYPTMRLSLSGQYYHRIASYNEDIISADFPRLINQDWNVDDLNVRITFRPKIPACLGTLALVTRYDFAHTSIDSRWEHEGEPFLAEQETGEIKRHVITESVNWNPLARFYLQANVSYTLNQTDTPANDISLVPNTSPTVTNFRNDYWTVTADAGYIINDKTNFYVDYSFYCANDHFKNAAVAVPFGEGATEHTASATLTRQLAKNVRLQLRYGYFNYRDVLSGGHNNYRAHSLYSGLQIRF